MRIHSDHLKIHMKTHDNQKPFQCTVCNRGYSTAAALTSHMQNHHKRAAERANSPQISGPSYKCLQCTQIFRKPDELQVGTRETHLLFPSLVFHPHDVSPPLPHASRPRISLSSTTAHEPRGHEVGKPVYTRMRFSKYFSITPIPSYCNSLTVIRK